MLNTHQDVTFLKPSVTKQQQKLKQTYQLTNNINTRTDLTAWCFKNLTEMSDVFLFIVFSMRRHPLC
jgi:hypothetical protein